MKPNIIHTLILLAIVIHHSFAHQPSDDYVRFNLKRGHVSNNQGDRR